jgi:hypothetical protein
MKKLIRTFIKLFVTVPFIIVINGYSQNITIPPANLGIDLIGNITEAQWTAIGGSTLSYNAVQGGFPITTDSTGLTNHEEWQNSISCQPSVFLQANNAYQFVLQIKADIFPSGQNVVITIEDMADHTQSVEYAYNVSQAGVWEDVIVPIIPKQDGDWAVKFIFVEPSLKYSSTLSTLFISPDVDVYKLPLSCEISALDTIHIATDKDVFESSTQRIDELGNIYTKSVSDTIWRHIFPKMMYKGYNGAFYPEDSIYYQRYKEYGFNGTMDVWTAAEAQATLDAGLEFISVSSNDDIDYYWTQVNNWADAGNHRENIIWYNYDNENANIADYNLQQSMGNWADTHYQDPSTGKRRHPIYFLNGQIGLPRTYHNSTRDAMDITGTYVGTSDALGTVNYMIPRPNLLAEFMTQNQRAPVTVIQLQSYFEHFFIPSLFYGIIMGGKALSVWRDGTTLNVNSPDFRQCIWADAFKNEVSTSLDEMLPIIKQPHFTSWSATSDKYPSVRIGTRELNDTAYLIITNFDSLDLTVNVNIQGKQVTDAFDYFTGSHIAYVSNGAFQFDIGHHNNGYRVIMLVDSNLNVSTHDLNNINIPINIYPNPTSDFIRLSVSTDDFLNLNYQIFNNSGKLIESKFVVNKITDISLKQYESSTYFLIVKKSNRVIKSFKIVKIE